MREWGREETLLLVRIFLFLFFFLFDLVQDSCNFFNTIFKTKLEPGRSKVLSRYRARETN